MTSLVLSRHSSTSSALNATQSIPSEENPGEERIFGMLDSFFERVKAFEICQIADCVQRHEGIRKDVSMSSLRKKDLSWLTPERDAELRLINILKCMEFFLEESLEEKTFEEIFQEAERRMNEATQELFSQGFHTIKWITGTSSSALPLIKRVQELSHQKISRPSLVPTGILLEHQIAPFSGSLSCGIGDKGVNHSALSGCLFIPQGIQTVLKYASRVNPICDPFIFHDLETLQLLGQGVSLSDSVNQITALALRILQLTEGKNVRDRLKSILQEISGKMEEKGKEKIQKLIDLCDQKSPILFSPAERLLLEKPFPVVFASYSLKSEELFPVRSDCPGEGAVARLLVLGKDVQLAFTTRENVERLKETLKELPVGIGSFEDLRIFYFFSFFNALPGGIGGF